MPINSSRENPFTVGAEAERASAARDFVCDTAAVFISGDLTRGPDSPGTNRSIILPASSRPNPPMPLRASLVRWDDLPLDKVTEMVSRKAISGAEQVLVQTYLKKGALVSLHVHAAEQFIYVLQGALVATVDGEVLTV